MKKKIIIISVIILAIILVFPIKDELNDGGTKEYKSLIYKVSKVHRYVPESETNESIKPYEDGIIIEILGFEIYNNVETNTYIESNQSAQQYENKYSFKAKVLTNNGNSNILVKVLEDSDFFKKNDEVNVFVDNYQFLNIYYTEDMNLEIYFDGSVEEIYPPQIHTSSISVTIPLISMDINRETITKDKLTIILMNNTDEDFVYGDDYLLEKMNEEKWIECETVTGEPLVWNAIAYYLKPEEQKEQVIDFKYSYGELSKGRYRITKKVFKDKDIPITEDKIQKIVAEFDIK